MRSNRAPHAAALLCAALPGRDVGADSGCRGWLGSAEPGQHLLEFLQRCWQQGMGLNYLVIAMLCRCGPREQGCSCLWRSAFLFRTSNILRVHLAESVVLVLLWPVIILDEKKARCHRETKQVNLVFLKRLSLERSSHLLPVVLLSPGLARSRVPRVLQGLLRVGGEHSLCKTP